MSDGMSDSRRWCLLTLLGGCLLAFGLVPFYVDYAEHIDLVEHFFSAFGYCILLGIIVVYVGCIGWARSIGSKHRAAMAGIVFFSPMLAVLVGSPVDRLNMHGPSAMTGLFLVVPFSALTLILMIMAAVAHKD